MADHLGTLLADWWNSTPPNPLKTAQAMKMRQALGAQIMPQASMGQILGNGYQDHGGVRDFPVEPPVNTPSMSPNGYIAYGNIGGGPGRGASPGGVMPMADRGFHNAPMGSAARVNPADMAQGVVNYPPPASPNYATANPADVAQGIAPTPTYASAPQMAARARPANLPAPGAQYAMGGAGGVPLPPERPPEFGAQMGSDNDSLNYWANLMMNRGGANR